MENCLTQITNYLMTQSWQIAALVVLVAATTVALKNRSAHVRYLLWLIVLAKCLMPPLVSVPLAVLPEGQLSEPIPVSAPRPPAMEFDVADVPVAEAPEFLRSFGEVAPAVPERAARFTLRQWLGLAWTAGVAVFLLFACIKALRTNQWLRQQRKPLLDETQGAIGSLFSDLGLKAFRKVWLVEGIGQPFVWGLLRGSIYLPANFVNVDNAEHRRVVLGHELSHILRLDAAVNILQVIAQALFWFHPFVWWVNRRIRAEREKCCDEMAIASLGAKAKDYSSAIVDTLITEYESTRPVPSLAVAGPVKNIEERIKTIMKPGKRFYKNPSLIAVTIVLLLALLTVPTALVLTARADSKTAESNEALTRKSIEAVKAAYDYSPASDPNLVAWWRLDDRSGSSARDSSGNDNHGTLRGDPQWTTGKIGGALDFDGDGDYVDCGNPDMFNFNEQITASAWINLRSVPGSSRAVVAKGEDGWRLALTRSTSGFEFAIAGKSFGYPGTLSGSQVAFGEWHHVCGTYDGETIRIYVDGQVDGTRDYARGIATNDLNLFIGDNPQWTGRFWDGLIDDVFVFSRALSDDEIRAVMQSLRDPALAQEPSPADRVQTNNIGMKLVWVPPGEFMMGSKFTPYEVNRRYVGNPVIFQNEHPQRKVKLTRGFWIGESEVTQAQYQAVMGSNPSHAKGDNLPVEMVSWPDAMEFCKKLSEKEGRTYTLPTEAQWEYAARAGTDTAYSFGDDVSLLGEYAWFGSDSGWKTNPVKTKKPNAFGLYDVHCNVWEWCRDWYQSSYDGLDNLDPTGPQSGKARVARGGTWHKYAGNCRSAVREAHNPDARNRYLNVGFRVVLLLAGVD